MVLQIEQFIAVLVWLVLAVLIWKLKNKKVRIFLIAIGLLVFFFNPLKLKQDGMSKLERFSSDIEMPEKVQVQTESFDDSQSREFNNLKTQSKDIENEID